MRAEKKFFPLLPNPVAKGYEDIRVPLLQNATSPEQKTLTKTFLAEFVELLALAQSRELKNPDLEEIKTQESFPSLIALDELHIIKQDYGQQLAQDIEEICKKFQAQQTA